MYFYVIKPFALFSQFGWKSKTKNAMDLFWRFLGI